MELKIKNKRGNKYQVLLIDDEDYNRIKDYTWELLKRGYKYSVINTSEDKIIYMPRLIMNVTDDKLRVHHIDKNTLNNQKSNLKIKPYNK